MSKEFSITTLQPCWDWLDNVTRSGKDQIETSADPQSNPQLLGCVGRLEHGWDGLVHLFPRAGSSLDRIAAPIRNSRDYRKHWLLWRPFFRTLHDWLRDGADAHGLLHWFFLCRGGQRFYRQPLWMEIYVRAGRRSGASDRLDSQQRPGAGALGK